MKPIGLSAHWDDYIDIIALQYVKHIPRYEPNGP